MTKEQQQEAETLNQEAKYYEGIMKGLTISKVLLSEGKMTNHNIEVEMNRYSTELMHRYQVQDALSCISDPPTALDLIAAERERHESVEGWTKESDQQHINGELAMAAIAYALPSTNYTSERDALIAKHMFWPKTWDPKMWKPTLDNRIKELVKSGALIAAELDRIIHLENKESCT